jgi:hypothetical protein
VECMQLTITSQSDLSKVGRAGNRNQGRKVGRGRICGLRRGIESGLIEAVFGPRKQIATHLGTAAAPAPALAPSPWYVMLAGMHFSRETWVHLVY